MTVCELCDRLSVAEEVKEKVAAIDRTYRHEALSAQWEKLYSPETWDEGVKELQAAFGEDPDGMKILTCMLHCCLKTREMYAEKGISEEVFYATMRFIPRFLEWQKKYYGEERVENCALGGDYRVDNYGACGFCGNSAFKAPPRGTTCVKICGRT